MRLSRVLKILLTAAGLRAGTAVCEIPLFPGARPAGMGNAWHGMAGAAECLFHNPAGIGAGGPVLSFSISRLFELEELSTASFLAAAGFHSISAGAGLLHFGVPPYTESACMIGTAVRLPLRLSAGIRFTGIRTCIQSLRSDLRLLTGAGLIFAPSSSLSVGLAAEVDGLPPKVRGAHRRFCTGLVLHLPGGLLSLDIEHVPPFPAEIKGGVEVSLHRDCSLRAGFSGHPSSLSLGAGFRKTRFSLDVAMSLHPVLGWSHILSMTVGIDPRPGSRP